LSIYAYKVNKSIFISAMTTLKNNNNNPMQVELFYKDNSKDFQNAINNWLKQKSREIISIEFSTEFNTQTIWKYALVTYRNR